MRSMRRLASLWICDILRGVLPERKKGWARAVRAEVDYIPDDGAAFLFALDALRGIVLFLIAKRLRAGAAIAAPLFSSFRSGIIRIGNQMLGDTRSRNVGIACATGAVLLGSAYLFMAGAPGQLIAVNAAALILGLTIAAIQKRMSGGSSRRSGIALMVMSFALLATAIGGLAVDGASRWVAIGPLAVQPSLIVLPVMIVMFARDRGPAATAGMLIAALALAMQPDRAMAGALMAGLAALAILHSDRFALVALAASVGAFVVTMAHPDNLPAAPYVDQILHTAFDVHLLAGLAVVAGANLLLVPALYGLRFGSVDRDRHVVFGVVWLSILLAAALGNYPTPVVGYGGSAVLGYLLSLGALVRPARAETTATSSARCRTAAKGPDLHSPFAPNQLA